MEGYIISGIQQMGVGVKDLESAWKWYIKSFGMDCPIFEEEAMANYMLPYTGGEPRSRHAVLAYNLQSGGGFEIWQYKGRIPLEISEEPKAGELGIFSCKIKVKDAVRAYEALKMNGVNILNAPAADPAGRKGFFVKDPYGNIFQLIEADDWFMNENKPTGGVYGAIIGVTDIEKARVVYSEILGYDQVLYDNISVFDDFSAVPGGERKLRRVLLKRSQPNKGAFSKLMGKSEIELISTGNSDERKIYRDRFWGDPGFIHLCFDINGMDNLREFCRQKGHPFTVDSMAGTAGNSFDMGEAAGHFSYIEDGDGTLIEFVETHKVPIMKKIGWYLDLRKRDPMKKLPDWMLKTLRFSRVKS